MIKGPGFRVSSLDARPRPNHQLDVGLPTITQSKDPSGPPGAGVLSLRCLSAYPHVGCNPRSWEVWNGVQGSIEFFFLRFFFYVTHFKIFIEFVTILFLFYILAFWPWGMWISTPRPGVEPASPALEGEVLTTRPPGKSRGSTNFKSFPGDCCVIWMWRTTAEWLWERTLRPYHMGSNPCSTCYWFGFHFINCKNEANGWHHFCQEA